MDSNLKHFVVLGGGPVGWLAAAFLNRLLNRFRPGQVAVTVLESPSLAPNAGFAGGARTLPGTLRMLGIDEHAFLTYAEASFSHGARFTDWLYDPRERSSAFFVPFDRANGSEAFDLGEAWIADRTLSPQGSFASAVSIQPTLAEQSRCPKLSSSRPYEAPVEYSYQFDPGTLAGLLRDVATRRGVRTVMGRCVALQRDAADRVSAACTESGARIAADFFIDCDGTLARVGRAHQSPPWVVYDRSLACDRQLDLHLPSSEDGAIRPFTGMHAASAGWIGQSDLAAERRMSYVYSSAFMSDAVAERELRTFAHIDESHPSSLQRFRPGRRREAWIENTLALGPAAGAIEPLVVAELGFVAAALQLFVEHLPQHGDGHDALRARANTHIADLYDEALDLTALHYRLSLRDDTAFWRAHRHDLALPERLRQDIEIWTHRLPHAFDRPSRAGLIDHQLCRFVLAGMDGTASMGSPYEAHISPTEAVASFQRLDRARAHALAASTDHAAYLRGLGEQQLTLAFAG